MRTASIVRWSLLAIFVLAGAGFAYAYSQGQYPGTALDGAPLVLLGGRIYDPITDSVSENMTVVIDGRDITAVGGEHTPIPDSARILDVRGLTLLPGFVDSHVNLSGIRVDVTTGEREMGWFAYFGKFVRKFPARRRAHIDSGVTTVKSLGDPESWIVSLAEQTARHQLAGPRIYAAGPIFTAPGGQPVARLRAAGQGDTSFIAQVTRQVEDTADARVAVNRIAADLDFVTAMVDRHNPDGLPGIRPQVLDAIVRAAEAQGLELIAQVRSVADLRIAVEAGAAGIEGMPGDEAIDLATLSRMRDRRVFVAPLLASSHYLARIGLYDSVRLGMIVGNVRRLLETDVPLIVSSAAPGPGAHFGSTVHDEMRLLVSLGLTPRQAIAAATALPAEQMGVSAQLGSIEPGKFADIVAVGGDPLTDISAAADIYLVIADGQVLLEQLAQKARRPGVIALARPNKREK